MKILVHMGQSKTGTTSLQDSFLNNRHRLADAEILYPDPPNGANAHHALSAIAEPAGPLPNHTMTRNGGIAGSVNAGEDILESLSRAKRDPKVDTVVLSSEALSNPRISAAGHKRLADRLRALSDDVQPILYIREPAAYFLSLYQENQKASTIVRLPALRPVRWIIETLEQAYGRPPLFATFARNSLIDGDIATDFIARFLDRRVDPKPFSGVAKNVSVSAESMSILRELGEILSADTPGERHPFSSVVLDVLHELDRGDPSPPRMKPSVTASIRAAAVDYRWLRDQFGVTFAELDYDRIDGSTPVPDLEQATLEELFEINDERRTRLAEAVTARLLGAGDGTES